MQSHQENVQLQSELEVLGAQIQKLRQPGMLLILPDDLKVRLCRLRQSGVSFSDIRRVTGVQANSIKAWAKKMPPVTSRPFRVVTVSEECREAEPTASVLTFRFASGKVTVDVPVSALSSELLRALTSC